MKDVYKCPIRDTEKHRQFESISRDIVHGEGLAWARVEALASCNTLHGVNT